MNPSESKRVQVNPFDRNAVSRARTQTKSARVIDIGTGSGVLSMMAARAGADQVHAVEQSRVLSEMGQEVIHTNGRSHTVQSIHKSSLDVTLSDIGGQAANVIVSETLGSTALDEASLMFIEDVRKRLATPDAIIIPAGVRTFAAVINCPALRNLSHVSEVTGFDNQIRSSAQILVHRYTRATHYVYTQTPRCEWPPRHHTQV